MIFKSMQCVAHAQPVRQCDWVMVHWKCVCTDTYELKNSSISSNKLFEKKWPKWVWFILKQTIVKKSNRHSWMVTIHLIGRWATVAFSEGLVKSTRGGLNAESSENACCDWLRSFWCRVVFCWKRPENSMETASLGWTMIEACYWYTSIKNIVNNCLDPQINFDTVLCVGVLFIVASRGGQLTVIGFDLKWQPLLLLLLGKFAVVKKQTANQPFATGNCTTEKRSEQVRKDLFCRPQGANENAK